MNDNDAHKQIRQMVNFILQESEEKAGEIRIKTEHDFNLEKQMLVHNAKLKIQEQYSRKEKEMEVEKRIARSSEIGQSRLKKMFARDELLKGMVAAAQTGLASIAQDKKTYTALIQSLIVQGLVKIDTPVVDILCREVDLPIVKQVAEAAKAQFLKTFADVGITTTLELRVNEKPKKMLAPPPSGQNVSCAGGVVLVSSDGRIVCDNTLDSRLELIFEALKPQIRTMLFNN